MKQRRITVGMFSGTAKMRLFEGTEYEKSCKIYGINDKPYVRANGTRYYLTEEEIETLKVYMSFFSATR